MSRVEGKLVTCDRCGKHILLKASRIDRPYTDYDEVVYEKLPSDWSKVGDDDLCPECSKEYEELMVAFFNMSRRKENEEQREV